MGRQKTVIIYVPENIILRIVLIIGAGSFIGGVLRYLVSHFIQTRSLADFPLGTLTVNIMVVLLSGSSLRLQA